VSITHFAGLTHVYRPVEKMNAAEKELLSLLRRKISHEKKFLADKVGLVARIVRLLITAPRSRFYNVQYEHIKRSAMRCVIVYIC